MTPDSAWQSCQDKLELHTDDQWWKVVPLHNMVKSEGGNWYGFYPCHYSDPQNNTHPVKKIPILCYHKLEAHPAIFRDESKWLDLVCPVQPTSHSLQLAHH